MRLFRTSQVLCLLATLAISPAFGTTTHKHPTSTHLRTASGKRGSKKKSHVIHGQRSIDSDRASEIQTALIRQKYLSGNPSGQWDAQTQAAMQQYQSDHGWQTKLMPDSRALISLGLGPNHPATTATRPAAQAENTTQAQSTEPAAANTLASVHSLSQ
jgi:peptidoglycan hydrolase-like protein with peptidoglycan-binding domain